jgi:hypothetical protein
VQGTAPPLLSPPLPVPPESCSHLDMLHQCSTRTPPHEPVLVVPQQHLPRISRVPAAGWVIWGEGGASSMEGVSMADSSTCTFMSRWQRIFCRCKACTTIQSAVRPQHIMCPKPLRAAQLCKRTILCHSMACRFAVRACCVICDALDADHTSAHVVFTHMSTRGRATSSSICRPCLSSSLMCSSQ